MKKDLKSVLSKPKYYTGQTPEKALTLKQYALAKT